MGSRYEVESSIYLADVGIFVVINFSLISSRGMNLVSINEFLCLNTVLLIFMVLIFNPSA